MEEIVSSTTHLNKIPQPDADRLLRSTMIYCGLVTKIGKEHYHAQNKEVFDYTIKFHYLIEIALRAPFLHPRKTWCYGSESFLQHVRSIIGRKAVATPELRVCNNAVQSYITCLQSELGLMLKLK
eukprot:7303475-Karenia_brevis.AAC.1